MFYFFSIDCYFHILLFPFYHAYLHYLCFLGVNFHSTLCSCPVQSIHYPSFFASRPLYLLPSPGHQQTAAPLSAFLPPLLLLPSHVVLLGLVCLYHCFKMKRYEFIYKAFVREARAPLYPTLVII